MTVTEKFFREVAEDVIAEARAEREAREQAESAQVTAGRESEFVSLS